jgi:hypothetical protein
MRHLVLSPRQAGLIAGALGVALSEPDVSEATREEMHAIGQMIAEAMEPETTTSADMQEHLTAMSELVGAYGFGFTITARIPQDPGS